MPVDLRSSGAPAPRRLARVGSRQRLELGETIEMFESVYASQVSIACFVALVLVGAVSDVVSYRIPNVLIVMLLVLYPIYAVVTPGVVEWVPSLIIFAAVIVVGLILHATKVFGAGDAKLLAAILLWAGPSLALPAFTIAVVVGGVMSLVMLSNARFVIASALSSISSQSLGDKFLARSMPWGMGLGITGIFVGWGLVVGQ